VLRASRSIVLVLVVVLVLERAILPNVYELPEICFSLATRLIAKKIKSRTRTTTSTRTMG
jgi:hypothetical protein